MDAETIKFIVENFISLLLVGFGALGGSLSAYYLARYQQRFDKREKEHSALLSAQFALMSQWNILEGFRNQVLEKYRETPERHLKMRRALSSLSPHRVVYSEITCIAESANPNLLQEIHLAEQYYDSCVNALLLRNEAYNNFLYKSGGESIDFDSETGKGSVHANPRLVYSLKEATDFLYYIIDKALPALKTTTDSLFAFMVDEYKGKEAIKMQIDSLNENPDYIFGKKSENAQPSQEGSP